MSKFGKQVTEWYKINKRALPWRIDQNPYHVWLSEIILQQTRVEQGLPYFKKFKETYPTIQSFANASEEDILKLWQGLGYYSRARNMHFTAKHIASKLTGEFPDNYNDLLKLKGIGDYTASAIASIAFGEKVPVVDGNVFRLVCRYYGITTDIQQASTKTTLKSLLSEEIKEANPGEFNQAIMEFGALQCKPVKPDCAVCPLVDNCQANLEGLVDSIPVKKKKIKLKKRFFTYLVRDDEHTILQKREENDIWKGLYQFPNIESNSLLDPDEFFSELSVLNWIDKPNNVELIDTIDLPKHILSHQHIYTRFVVVKNISYLHSGIQVDRSNLEQYPIPRIIDKFLEKRPKFLIKN